MKSTKKAAIKNYERRENEMREAKLRMDVHIKESGQFEKQESCDNKFKSKIEINQNLIKVLSK